MMTKPNINDRHGQISILTTITFTADKSQFSKENLNVK